MLRFCHGLDAARRRIKGGKEAAPYARGAGAEAQLHIFVGCGESNGLRRAELSLIDSSYSRLASAVSATFCCQMRMRSRSSESSPGAMAAAAPFSVAVSAAAVPATRKRRGIWAKR
jgi:hypothetical protein